LAKSGPRLCVSTIAEIGYAFSAKNPAKSKDAQAALGWFANPILWGPEFGGNPNLSRERPTAFKTVSDDSRQAFAAR